MEETLFSCKGKLLPILLAVNIRCSAYKQPPDAFTKVVSSILFHHSETLVSPRRNSCFIKMKQICKHIDKMI